MEAEALGLELPENPSRLYGPIRYILSLGGKRTRPLLVLLACEMHGTPYAKALKPALAVEVFHNFTLMHDDIMDKAPLRRGNATVHEKWDSNVAILSGDAMMVKAYGLLLETPHALLPQVLALFNKCALEVCEGQQLDMDFEALSSVSEAQYIEMIRLKTAVLLGTSLELGALLGGATNANAAALREFGISLGIAFQLKDDLLDAFGDQEKTGKQVGGDILANKKTFLLVKALALATDGLKNALLGWLNNSAAGPLEKIRAVKEIYAQLGIEQLARLEIDRYFQHGLALLEALPLPEQNKTPLKSLAWQLYHREK